MKARVLQVVLSSMLIVIVVIGIVTTNRELWDDKVIKSPGHYLLEGNRELVVAITDADYVSFVLKYKGKSVVVRRGRDSAFHHFRLMWESKHNRLWFNSSDTGAVVYISETSATYTAHSIVPRIYADIDKPQILIENVPSDIRRQLNL